jgi:hypothetical protein
MPGADILDLEHEANTATLRRISFIYVTVTLKVTVSTLTA